MAANAPDPLAGMSDAELGAYCDAHLGDEALAAALAPMTAGPTICRRPTGNGLPSWPTSRWTAVPGGRRHGHLIGG